MPRREITDVDRNAGNLLRRKRWETGVTQTELAEAVGCAPQQIQKYERGINTMSAGRIAQFCSALNVGPSYFFQAPDPELMKRSRLATELAAIYDVSSPMKQAALVQIARHMNDV
jgi:transcriptional regulator with XRE-family HTH domain